MIKQKKLDPKITLAVSGEHSEKSVSSQILDYFLKF